MNSALINIAVTIRTLATGLEGIGAPAIPHTAGELVLLADALEELALGQAPTVDNDRTLSEKEAATLLGMSESNLRKFRSRGEIASVKVGKIIRYRRATLRAWLDDHERVVTSQNRISRTIKRIPAN